MRQRSKPVSSAVRGSSNRRSLIKSSSALLALGVAATAADAQAAAARSNRVVLQVSDADPARWGLALNNAGNLQAELGGPGQVDLEIVVFGPGIGMLKSSSPVGARVASALKSGLSVVACQNTMRGQQLTPADMLPAIGYVPSGVAEIVRKQQQGWAYVRP
jgi:uncharacterized protein